MLNENTQEILIFHYSVKTLFSGEIIASSDEILRIKVKEKNLRNSIYNGDPIVLGFIDRDSEVKIIGCDASKYNYESSELEVKIDRINIEMRNRLYQRFPVSLYADIKDLYSNKSYNAFVKDISKYGVLIYTKALIPKERKVQISIHLEDSGIFFDAGIARFAEMENYNAYGLTVPSSDAISSRSVNKLLRVAYENFQKKIDPEITLSIKFDQLQFATFSGESVEEQKLKDHLRKLDDILKGT